MCNTSLAADVQMLLLAIFVLFFSIFLPRLDATKSRREVISVEHAAVATDDGRCSRIGMDALREGGHAVDAAVAAALCLGVVNPASSGIGGGAFMIVRLASGKVDAFDMRETAPMQASENMYGGNATLKLKGPLSIAIPGELAGLHEAWKQHGKLPWERLVRPAEALARFGYKISPYLYGQMDYITSGMFTDEGLRDVYTSNGSLLQPGDTCRNLKLAETLREISKLGAAALYHGSVGSKLVRDVQKAGGILTMNDLRGYKVKMREPISADILGLKVLGMPPPSGGPAMLLMLKILSQYSNATQVPGPLWIHRAIESLKHVFSVRMNLGDPDFVNVTKVLADMLSPKFASELKKNIDDNKTFDPSHYGSRWGQIDDHGTSHLSIIDPQGNAASMTTTVNRFFGAQMLSSGTGIVLNNQMDDFSIPANVSNTLPPSPPNLIWPGKRPLSSMTPTIILKDKQLKAVVGASGGNFIVPGLTEVLLNHFARRMDLLSSVMAPRVYHQLIPNVVQYENWTTVVGDHLELPAPIRESLRKKGHVLQSQPTGAVCQLIVLQREKMDNLTNNRGKRKIVAVSDPRKGGFPAGF